MSRMYCAIAALCAVQTAGSGGLPPTLRLPSMWGMKLLLPSVCFLLAPPVIAQVPTTGVNPEELGRVRWLRDFDAAKKRAKKERKPVLLLFQEVPG